MQFLELGGVRGQLRLQRLVFAGQRRGDVLLNVAVEERGELIILPLTERIVFVIVTLRAVERDAEEDLRRRVDAIDHLLDAELLLIDAALAIGERVAMKARRHLLFERRPPHQIAGQLLDDELVIRQIAIEGVDHPVAIAPGVGPTSVFLITVAVGIACQVEPVSAPAFAIVRRGQQAIDQALIRIRLSVVEKFIDLCRSRRQAKEVDGRDR